MCKIRLILCFNCVTSFFIWSFSLANSARPVMGCGEQCVKLLCKYYGIEVHESDILKSLSPNELGECSFKDIIRCIKYIGLDSYAFKSSIEELRSIHDPVILLFKKSHDDKIGHFIVGMLDRQTNDFIGYDPVNSGIPFELTTNKLESFWPGAGLVVFKKQSTYTSYLLFPVIMICLVLMVFFFIKLSHIKLQNQRVNNVKCQK